jgi:outer membrane protein OmpA-like peptidoglycan-associated protein
MTRILSIMTIGAALSMTAGLAVAGSTVSADKIVDALKPKPGATRGLSTGPQQPVDTATQAKESGFVNTLRNRKTRSLSLGERQEIAELAATKPKIDLEIQFDYNSADISKNSVTAVQELGKALSDTSLKGSTFVVAGHTDAIGGEAYNQDLSERRADTIKKYLTEKYGITGSDLVTVGYGKTKPKDANAPMDPANLRHRVFSDTFKRSKLRRFRIHDLRHTFASLLINQGENLKYIQTQLGHSSITTTVDRYGHLMPEAHRGVNDRLDATLFGDNAQNLDDKMLTSTREKEKARDPISL